MGSHNTAGVKAAPRATHASEGLTPGGSSPNWTLRLFGTTITAVVVLAACLVSSGLRHQLALSVWRQPASYTELGFINAAALPLAAVQGQAVSFSFAVTNDGSDPGSYEYLVAAGSGTQLKPLAAASAQLAPGQVWKVNKSIVPSCRPGTCHIQVSLPKEREAIDFTVNLAHQR